MMGGETGGCVCICGMLRGVLDAVASFLCWNEADDDMLGRAAWNADDVGEVLKRMFLWW